MPGPKKAAAGGVRAMQPRDVPIAAADGITEYARATGQTIGEVIAGLWRFRSELLTQAEFSPDVANTIRAYATDAGVDLYEVRL